MSDEKKKKTSNFNANETCKIKVGFNRSSLSKSQNKNKDKPMITNLAAHSNIHNLKNSKLKSAKFETQKSMSNSRSSSKPNKSSIRAKTSINRKYLPKIIKKDVEWKTKLSMENNVRRANSSSTSRQPRRSLILKNRAIEMSDSIRSYSVDKKHSRNKFEKNSKKNLIKNLKNKCKSRLYNLSSEEKKVSAKVPATSLKYSFDTKRKLLDSTELNNNKKSIKLEAINFKPLTKIQFNSDLKINRAKSQLQEYIGELIRGYHPDNEFIYALRSTDHNPYDVVPVSFTQISQNTKYYITISQKAVIEYKNNKQSHFWPIEEWIEEKHKYSKLEDLKFIQKFRKIKYLIKWKYKILNFKRRYYRKCLETNLLYIDPYIKPRLLIYKEGCQAIESLKYFAISNRTPMNIKELIKLQKMRNESAFNLFTAVKKSNILTTQKLTDNFKMIIWKIVFPNNQDRDVLEKQISKSKSINKKDHKNQKQTISKQDMHFFEYIKRSTISFKSKSLIRDMCQKLLKIPLLLDFMILDSVRKCYDLNLKEFEKRLNIPSEALFSTQIEENEDNFHETIKPLIEVTLNLASDFNQLKADNKQTIKLKNDQKINPFFFDLMINLHPKEINFYKFKQKVKQAAQGTYLDENMIKEVWFEEPNESETYPSFIAIRKLNCEAKLMSLDPSLHEVTDFYKSQFSSFCTLVSSLPKTIKLCNFEFFKLFLNEWNLDLEAMTPDRDTNNLNEIYSSKKLEIDLKNKITNYLESGYQEAELMITKNNEYLNQYWRNCKIHQKGNI